MAKLRAMNEQHPELLAQIWEQERQQHLHKIQAAEPPKLSPQVPMLAAPLAKQPPKEERTPAARQPKRSVSVHLPTKSTLRDRSTQSPASTPQTRESRWPQEKKDQISRSATAWLNAFEKNKDFHISVDAFRQILDRNPTYIELCEQLEAMGCTLERGAFAKALLGTLSHINNQAPGPAPGPPPGPRDAAPQSKTELPFEPNVGRKIVDTQASTRGSYRPTANNSQSPRKLSISPAAKQVMRFIDGQWQAEPLTSPQYPPWRGANTPPAYQMTSSHRSPSEDDPVGVDYVVPHHPDSHKSRPFLAPIQSSEDLRSRTNSASVSKALAAKKRDIGDIVDLTALSDDDLPPMKKQMTPENHSTLSNQKHNPQSQRYVMQQHFPRPLQTPPQKATALEEDLRNVKVIHQIQKNDALRRSRYNVATIARDVLLATGKHPDLAGLNSHLDVLKNTLSKLGVPGYRIDGTSGNALSNPDLSTLRWDVLDPGEPVHIRTVDEVNISEEADNADDESEPDQLRLLRPTLVNQQLVTADDRSLGIVTEETRPSYMHSKKGVQNKVKARQSHSGILSQPTALTPAMTPSSPSKKGSRSVGRPPRPTVPPATTLPVTGYTAFKQTLGQNTNGETAKKRGRPVGWRKHLHMKTPTPGRSADDGSSKTPKLQDEESVTPSQPMKHIVFECKWKDCFARLHNLETLRKHVHKIHGIRGPSGRLECYWEGCGKFSFAERLLWLNHVEQSHLGPVSWSLGDGPPAGFSGKE